jgi:hypothetical protein
MLTITKPHLLWLLLLLPLPNCRTSRARNLQSRYLNFQNKPLELKDRAAADSVRIAYTGCGGYLLEYGGEAVLVDPFFSNTSILQVAFGRLRTDTVAVNGFFRRRIGASSDVRGQIGTVLISHAHHDHLADVPELLRHNLAADRVRIYGSRTVVNLLRSYPDLLPDTAGQLVNLEKEFKLLSAVASDTSQPAISKFHYTAGRRMRFAAIPSNHAGHYELFYLHPRKLPFTKGHIDAPLTRPPRHALSFKEGQNFNFLIDLLDENGQAVLRLFSNAGAACDARFGFPPQHALRERPVDVLLICGANYDIAANYPEPLLDYLAPRVVFVVHWENFFKPIVKLQKRPQVVPNTNIPKLMHRLEHYARTHERIEAILLQQPLEHVVNIKF